MAIITWLVILLIIMGYSKWGYWNNKSYTFSEFLGRFLLYQLCWMFANFGNISTTMFQMISYINLGSPEMKKESGSNSLFVRGDYDHAWNSSNTTTPTHHDLERDLSIFFFIIMFYFYFICVFVSLIFS